MKKLEIIIRPEKMEIVKAILDKNGINGMNLVSTMGYGNQNGVTHSTDGTEYNLGLVLKLKIETIVDDQSVDAVVNEIIEEVSTGNYGDGKIVVYPVDDCIRIRTGEHGTIAL